MPHVLAVKCTELLEAWPSKGLVRTALRSWPPAVPAEQWIASRAGRRQGSPAGTTGPASSWHRRPPARWPGGCWCAAVAATGSWPFYACSWPGPPRREPPSGLMAACLCPGLVEPRGWIPSCHGEGVLERSWGQHTKATVATLPVVEDSRTRRRRPAPRDRHGSSGMVARGTCRIGSHQDQSCAVASSTTRSRPGHAVRRPCSSQPPGSANAFTGQPDRDH